MEIRTLGHGSWESFEFSLIESGIGHRSRFTWAQVWTTTHNILYEWKFYMEFRMASVKNIGWDCREFLGTTREGRSSGMCRRPRGTTHNNLLKIRIIILRTLNSYWNENELKVQKAKRLNIRLKIHQDDIKLVRTWLLKLL